MTEQREPTWLNLDSIARAWDDSLTPTSAGPGAASTGGGPPKNIDGWAAPLPIPQHAIDARVETLTVLADLAKLIRDETGQTHHAPPGPVTIHHRIALVAGHADWIDATHPGHAARLDAARHKLEKCAYPGRPTDKPLIGYCQRAVPSPDGHGDVTCGGPVHAYLDPADATGRAHYTSAQCRRCRTDAVLDWWAHHFGVTDHKPLVTARELVTVLAFEAGHATTTSTIRTWVERGVITTAGETDDRGARLFDRSSTIAALRARSIIA